MDREVMKDKIKKLLALSADNPSDAESYSALQKAQELMVQYKIEAGELDENNPTKECVTKDTEFKYGSGSSDTYLSSLSKIIADNFCCITYLNKYYGEKTRHITFMGYEEDVDVAIEAMTIANMTIIAGYNRVWKEMCKEYNLDYIPARYFNPSKIGYIKGYLAGLKEVFESQKEKNPGYGLILVAPQEAQDFVAGLRSEVTRGQRYNENYYDQGYQDGKQFNMNKKVEGRKALEG